MSKNFYSHPFYTVYNREIADNQYAELIKAGTSLKSDQHEVCLHLCGLRNEMIRSPYALFNTDHVFHDKYRSLIENNDLRRMLHEVNLPSFRIRCFAYNLLTCKDFGDSDVYIRENGETVTLNDAVLYAKNCLGVLIEAIQRYLYIIDKKYGTIYMKLNFPASNDPSEYIINADLEKIFVDDVIRRVETY